MTGSVPNMPNKLHDPHAELDVTHVRLSLPLPLNHKQTKRPRPIKSCNHKCSSMSLSYCHPVISSCICKNIVSCVYIYINTSSGLICESYPIFFQSPSNPHLIGEIGRRPRVSHGKRWYSLSWVSWATRKLRRIKHEQLHKKPKEHEKNIQYISSCICRNMKQVYSIPMNYMDFPSNSSQNKHLGVLGWNQSLQKGTNYYALQHAIQLEHLLHNRMTPKVNDSLPVWLRNSISFCVAWSKIQRECSSTLGVKNTRAWQPAAFVAASYGVQFGQSNGAKFRASTRDLVTKQLKEMTETLPLTIIIHNYSPNPAPSKTLTLY